MANWIETASNAHSYRRMYDLADEILASGSPPVDVAAAALAVKSELAPVIDKPIARAAKLAKARRRFDLLKSVLEESAADGSRKFPGKPSLPHRPVARLTPAASPAVSKS